MTGLAGRYFSGRVVFPALHQGTVIFRPLCPFYAKMINAASIG